jgi:Kef-type K+ transport system membrane component KefB
MPQISFVSLLIVAAVDVPAPLLRGCMPRLRLPAVVVEIVAGVVLGPSVLSWVHGDLPVQILAILGLAFLLFLAGLEIDLRALRGHALRVAVLSYGLTLVLGVAVGAGLGAVGWTMSPLLIAIALSATSLGLVVPVLIDAGQADSDIGQTIIASATAADFAAIVLLTLFFSTSGRGVGSTLVLLAMFAGLVVIVGVLLIQVGRSMRLGTVLLRLQDTTAEIRVRRSVALLIRFVALAERSAGRRFSAPFWLARW